SWSLFRGALDQHNRPLFRTAEGGIDERLLQDRGPRGGAGLRPRRAECAPDGLPGPIAGTGDVARLVRRVLARQVPPARPGTQYPEHAVEHRAGFAPRPTASVGSSLLAQQWPDRFPLRIAQVHASGLL